MDPEHIEPVRSLPLERRSRARTFLTAFVPAVVLIAVVGAAILGSGKPSDGPSTEAEQNGESAGPAVPQPESTVAPDVAALSEAGFPTRALGLPVHSVARTVERHADGEIRGAVVAVAGWLSVPPDPACGVDRVDERDDLYGTGAACRRGTVLAGDAEPVLAVRSGGIRDLREPGAVLRPIGLPGPSLATIAAVQVATDDVILPERAVVLGRFADPRLEECRSSSTSCVSTFEIERVVWVDGSWRLRRPLIYPSEIEAVPSGMVRWPTVDRAIRRGAIILSETILPRGDLATIDPDADALTPRDAGTVWYVRALLRPRGIEDSAGEVGWAVIDDDTAVVLASDPERTDPDDDRVTGERGDATPGVNPESAPPSATDTPVALPDRMFGLRVLDVEEVQSLAGKDVNANELVAIEGWLTVAPDQPGCAAIPVMACPRQGTLSGTRESGGPSIGVETLPGTPLLGLTRQNPSLGTWTVPNRVALVGRLRGQPAQCVDPSGCELVLTIERLAWLRTTARQRPVLTAPASLESAWSREAAEKVARDAIDDAGATLLLSLVDRPTLRLLDEDASAAIVGATGRSPVWYLRTIVWPSSAGSDGQPVVGWSVVDDRSHAVLATGVRDAAT